MCLKKIFFAILSSDSEKVIYILCVTSFLNVLHRDDMLYCTFNCNEMVFSVEDPEPEDGDLDADPDGGVQATHLAVVKACHIFSWRFTLKKKLEEHIKYLYFFNYATKQLVY